MRGSRQFWIGWDCPADRRAGHRYAFIALSAATLSIVNGIACSTK
jgi:hypothetical protein